MVEFDLVSRIRYDLDKGENMRHKIIIERIKELNPDALFVSGFDEAVIGHTHTSNSPEVAIYDTEMCIAMLCEKGMSLEDSVEYFEGNVLVSYLEDKNNPIFISL